MGRKPVVPQADAEQEDRITLMREERKAPSQPGFILLARSANAAQTGPTTLVQEKTYAPSPPGFKAKMSGSAQLLLFFFPLTLFKTPTFR